MISYESPKILQSAVLMTAVLALGACANNSDSPTGAAGNPIKEVVLDGGIVCEVMDGGGKAISCDWEHPTSRTPDENPTGAAGNPITMILTKSGVTCAVMDGGGKAISCDWGNPKNQ